MPVFAKFAAAVAAFVDKTGIMDATLSTDVIPAPTTPTPDISQPENAAPATGYWISFTSSETLQV